MDDVSEERVRELLRDLFRELERTDSVGEETVAAARRLESGIEARLDAGTEAGDGALDDLVALQARFAASHPVAERILRDLVDHLGRIGI